jgi:defect-in-organelle-trafficking protein DotC
MPRKTVNTSTIKIPALCAALLAFASPAAAQNINQQVQQGQQQALAQAQQEAQINPFNQLAPAPTSSQDPNAAAAAYAPYGMPGYTMGQPQEEQVKVRRVMYEDLEQDVIGVNKPPPDLEELQSLPRDNTIVEGETGMPFDIRRDALREAAASFGARGGLAWRTYHIRNELETRAKQLDKVYDFRLLLIPAPSGLLIEPPVISESLNALLIEDDGQQAAVSDAVYNITNNAKIVSTARTWRTYLEREWGDVDPPPDILRPENDEERRIWEELVAKGWDEGIIQANEIFQEDLNVLQADFQGMVRYRLLLTQGKVSPPYALQVDRGVTGDGEEMRIGDRAVQITGKPELITGTEQWQPASR